jgi:hypothetical protein
MAQDSSSRLLDEHNALSRSVPTTARVSLSHGKALQSFRTTLRKKEEVVHADDDGCEWRVSTATCERSPVRAGFEHA